ncbi:MAG: hypothetical protein OHK0056_12280 [Bacteriovoracaceae bacterium]
MTMTADELFLRALNIYSKRIAVSDRDCSLTYCELDELSNKILLKISSLPKHSVVAICLSRSRFAVASFIALLKSQCIYLPIDSEYPTDRIEEILSDAKVSAVLVDSETQKLINIKFNSIDVTQLTEIDFVQPFTKSQTDPAYMIYTSGSTGKPKGVLVSHGNLVQLINWITEKTRVKDCQKSTLFSSLSFDASILEMLSSLANGLELVVVDSATRKDLSELLSLIQTRQIDRLFVPIAVLQLISEELKSNGQQLNFIKEINCGGDTMVITEEIRQALSKMSDVVLNNQYGPTECTVMVSNNALQGDPRLFPDRPSLGVPVADTSFIVLSSSGEKILDGEVGELLIAGSLVALGYFEREELTKQKFIQFEGMRCYRTGDLVHIDETGAIHFHGRIDDQIKINGVRVEIGEIEAIIQEMLPHTQNAVVLDRAQGHSQLITFIKGSFDITELQKNLIERLPRAVVPTHFVSIDEMPLTNNGKIDRKKLSSLIQRNESTTIDRSDILGVIRSASGLNHLEAKDHFFQNGMTSLQAMKCVAELKRQLSLKVSIADFFTHSSAYLLEKHLAKNSQSKVNPRNVKKSGRKVAVVGMACKFPGASNLEEFWKMLVEGKEGLQTFSNDELSVTVSEELKKNPNYVKARGVIEDADQFDASFFGLSPRVCEMYDPQLRQFLMLAEHALNHAGISPQKTMDRIGVYAGMSNNTYLKQIEVCHPEKIQNVGEWSVATFNEKDYIATQVSHKYNLKGPSLSIHSACSTSLVAIAEASKAIGRGDCEVALTGGIHINALGNIGHLYQEGAIFSRDGHTRTFDISASGTQFSDGMGIVVLKDLDRAIEDGDQILAIVAGVGVNNDGSDKSSFTAPSKNGQRDCIVEAMQAAGIDASDLIHIEAHGTATPVGDPIEVEALKEALDIVTDGHKDRGVITLGSLKSQFGHSVASAGVAGFIKSVLILNRGLIPGTLHFKQLNPMIQLEGSGLQIDSAISKLDLDSNKRFASVSSFGVGGTNAHVVIEKYEQASVEFKNLKPALFCFSAHSDESMRLLLKSWIEFLMQDPDRLDHENLAANLIERRTDRSIRFTVVANNRRDLISKISSRLMNEQKFNKAKEVVTFGFAMPGQGGQYMGMGKELYTHEPKFKEVVDRCHNYLLKKLDFNLIDVMFDEKNELINQTQYTQPAIFVFEIALATMISEKIGQAACLIGHSVGEFAGAVLSQVMSLEDALLAVTIRAKLMQNLPAGAMMTIRLPAENVRQLINDERIQIAAVNTLDSCVVAGEFSAIEELEEKCKSLNILAKRLVTSHAFHSAMMNPMLSDFRATISSIDLKKPQTKFISTTKAMACDEDLTRADYWVNHVRESVLFAQAAEILIKENPDLIIDIGPRAIMTQLLAPVIRRNNSQCELICANAGSVANEYEQFLKALGLIWENGISFGAMKKSSRYQQLPETHFVTKSYWAGYPLKKLLQNINIEPTLMKGNLMSDLKTTLIDDLISAINKTSGLTLKSDEASLSFLELGLDSLLLTQLALDLSKRYESSLTFRQLMDELVSIELLADYLVANHTSEIKKVLAVAPASAPISAPVQAQAPAPAPTTVVTPVAQNSAPVIPVAAPVRMNTTLSTTATGLEGIIAKQLELMQNQLALMSGQTMQVSVAAPIVAPQVPTSAPVAPVVPVVEKRVEVKKTEDVESLEVKATVNTAKTAFGAQARISTDKGELNTKEKEVVAEIIKRYTNHSPKSKEFTQKYRAKNADPRVVTGFRPDIKEMVYPVVVNRSVKQHLFDIDGNEYIDMICGFGSNFFGNQNERINKALHDQLDRGMEIGPQHELVGECAELICELTGSERAAFCNTGSEAVLGALRISRTITGRKKIVMFKGSYHGINDEVIVRGLADGRAMPAAAGINPSSLQDIIVLDYGTDESLEKIRQLAPELAAVISETVQSRRCDFRPVEFLKEVRKITEASGTALIFDEVITGFRIAPGGAQEYFGIRADLATYGKIIGGGLPVGVIAGKSKFMDALDGGFWQYGDDSGPTVPLTYFAGTFVRHPLTLRAMREALLILKEGGKELYNNINQTAKDFVSELNTFCELFGAPIVIDHFGGVLKPRFTETGKNYDLFYALMRMNGVHCYDGFPWFITLAHSTQDLRTVAETFKKCIIEMQSLGLFPSKFLKSNTPSIGNENDFIIPPAVGAILMKDEFGNPAWFVKNPQNPKGYDKISG